VTDNFYKFVVRAVAGPAGLVPLASLANKQNGFSVIALRNAPAVIISNVSLILCPTAR
jgi:hypothetical protein